MDAADRAKRDELLRGIAEPHPAYQDAARLIAHCALALYGDGIRDQFVEEVLAARSPNTAHNAMLECIALCEPHAGITSEERLRRIQWTLYRALREPAAGWMDDLKGDRAPECAVLGIELPDDDREMQTYDDRGEPVSTGRL